MSIEEKLRKLILSRSKSLMSFCKESGLNYTTVMSALSRGIQNASFSTVKDLAHALGMEADDLASESDFDAVMNGDANGNGILEFVKNNQNIKMVAKIGRELSPEGQKELLRYAQFISNEKNRGVE